MCCSGTWLFYLVEWWFKVMQKFKGGTMELPNFSASALEFGIFWPKNWQFGRLILKTSKIAYLYGTGHKNVVESLKKWLEVLLQCFLHCRNNIYVPQMYTMTK
jgi:hypothetical protein